MGLSPGGATLDRIIDLYHPTILKIKERFNAVHTAQLLSGLGFATYVDPEFLEIVALHYRDLLSKTNRRVFASTVPRVMWACAQHGQVHDGLLASVTDKFVAGMARNGEIRFVTPEGLLALRWAYELGDKLGNQYDEFKNVLDNMLGSNGR